MTTTSFEVRDLLEQRLEKDLLGPADGPDEELPAGTIPAERYLLGRLVPRTPDDGGGTAEPTTEDADFTHVDLIDGDVTLDAEQGNERESEKSTRTGSMASSALGLSFMVPDDVSSVLVEASWGRYEQAQSTTQMTEQERPRSVWRRKPSGGPIEVPVDSDGSDSSVPDPEQEGVVVTWTVRGHHMGRGSVRIVHVSLVNALPRLTATPDLNRLYQAGLQVSALDGNAAVFVGHNDPDFVHPTISGDQERAHLGLLHRAVRKYATGSHCAVDADVHDGDRRAWRLRTTCFPTAEVAPVVPGDPALMPGVVLDMDRLGNPGMAADKLVTGLIPLVTGYRTWLEGRRSIVEGANADVEIADHRAVAENALDEADEVADRLERAIDCCATTAKPARHSGSQTRRWPASGCAASSCDAGPPTRHARPVTCSGSSTCRATAVGAPSSWPSSCSASLG